MSQDAVTPQENGISAEGKDTSLSVVGSEPVNEKATNGSKPAQNSSGPSYGAPSIVRTSGSFPALGSTLGKYFCVGRLGKGTFCSIHQCINLHYFPEEDGSCNPRLAAAKVEVGTFKNSGVLSGEAVMLEFLDAALPKNTVPTYMGHLRGGETSVSSDKDLEAGTSAIVMEYLPGQDMHVVRDWATKLKSRRLTIQDAVYLTANQMLPLLQKMHQAGIVHRDVKPSNCVKRGGKNADGSASREFCMVDFGLSKSVVVPKDSPWSDPDHPFGGSHWIRPSSYDGPGHYRKEREKAEFRGTSMYASVRVHQLKDYCPRDDMWSLMYVFCDLVSGGLPWMSYAANRDRDSCQKMKELIHGEVSGLPDRTECLLMGNEYHVAFFKKHKGVGPAGGVSLDDNEGLPEPLSMSKDSKRVDLLRKAFAHIGGLSFSDMPDYDLIKASIEGFLDGEPNDPSLVPIDWDLLEESHQQKKTSPPLLGKRVPTWQLDGEDDPVNYGAICHLAEKEGTAEFAATKLVGEAIDLGRLPLELRFRIAQMEYNKLHHTAVPKHLALRDWLQVALPLLYGKWDSEKFERGGHRSNDDGYRRETYLKIVEKCIAYATKFDNFRHRDFLYVSDSSAAPRKKRKISTTMAGTDGSDLLAISQTFFRLKAAQKLELQRSRPPPPRLSFGSSAF